MHLLGDQLNLGGAQTKQNEVWNTLQVVLTSRCLIDYYH